jgi:hypothetical protein
VRQLLPGCRTGAELRLDLLQGLGGALGCTL